MEKKMVKQIEKDEFMEDDFENYVDFIEDQNDLLIRELKRVYLCMDQMLDWMHSVAKGRSTKKFPTNLNVAELIRKNHKVRRSLINLEAITKEKKGLKILENIKEIEAPE
jgi:hypothetical protein